MIESLRCAVIVPALNEAGAIGVVVRGIQSTLDARVIVVDNGSHDETAAEARAAGAEVIDAPARGYGHACLRGMAAAPEADVLVFIDGDGSMAPGDMPSLIEPISQDRADIVCGSRGAAAHPGSMPAHQALGNRVAVTLLGALYGVHLSDLGPYRAARGTTLRRLGLRPSRYAFPAEMLARAARRGARITEVPVSYRRRIAGRSKVSGTLAGSLGAGLGILGALAWQRIRPR